MGSKGRERKRVSWGGGKGVAAAYLQHVAVLGGVEVPMGDAEAAGFDPKQGHAHVGLGLPEALPELVLLGGGVRVLF